MNYVCFYSVTSIARGSTRWIIVAVLFRNTDLTGNGIQRNIKSSEKLEPT